MDSQRPGAAKRVRRALGIMTAGILVLASLSVPAAEAAIGDLHPFAGGIGDGGQSAAAALVLPAGVAVDGATVYLADAKDHRVRKIDSTGVISTVAGTGVAGYTGDGDPAATAKIDSPRDVAVDASGNLYIADDTQNVVRKVSTSGVISTFAGKGSAGYSGDSGLATAAELSQPTGVAVDASGNVFIADFGNKRVRKVNASDGNISTIAGTGTAMWQGDGLAATQLTVDPYDVAVDPAGNVYVADFSNNRVRKIDTTGTMMTVAGGVCPTDVPSVPYGTVPVGDNGPAGLATLCRPSSVALDATGNLFVADTNQQRIRKIDATTTVPLDATRTITTVAGSGVEATLAGDTYTCPDASQGAAATASALCFPGSVAVDANGVVYVSDAGNALLRKVIGDGSMPTAAGQRFGGDGGQALVAVLRRPRGVATDGKGNVFVSDTANNRVRRISPGGVITTVAGTGTAGFAGDAAAATEAQLNAPTGLALDPNGVLYIADTQNDRIRRVDAAGIISTVAGNGTAGFGGDAGPAVAAQINKPEAIALGPTGDLYVADTQNGRVRRVDSGGNITTVAGNGTAGFAGDGADPTLAQLNKPAGVAVFESSLFISDTENHRIRKVAGNVISSIAGTGTAGCAPGATPLETALSHPAGIAADVIGQVFITNADCGTLLEIDSDGKIETLAGTGVVGYAGDSGKATETILGRLVAVATDRTGSIYLADQSNDRVRLVEGRPPDALPPVPSFAVSTSIIANAAVAFNEEVKNVMSSNVVLRAVGSPANVAATQVCRDGASAIVACTGGKVRRVDVDPAVSLIPGQSYAVIVNPAEAATKITDAAGNATPATAKTFRASTVEQEGSPASRYAWRFIGESGAIGRSYAAENTPGASATVTFTGRSVIWYTKAGPDQGLANVYIDGVFKGTFNQFATSAKFGVARIFDGLSDASHRFVLVARGLKGSSYATDTRVALDGIRAGGVLYQNPGATYGWQSIPNAKASSGRYSRSRFTSSAVSFTFHGTGIDWYTIAAPSMGIASVYVDGVLKATIDNYAATEVFNVRRGIRGLSNATHTMKIVVTGRKNTKASATFVCVDRYVIF
jgi:sugar lactone lactonase YvrE